MTAAAVAHGVLYWLAGSAAAVLALCLADNLLRLPAALRLAAAALVAGLSLHALWTRVVRPARTPLSAEGAARAAEAASGRGDNLLINACQLEGAELGEGARVLLAPALAEARSAAVGLPQARLLGLRALALWALVALCCAAGWTAYAGRFGDHAANALRRLALPLADVPPVGSVALVLEPSGDVTVAEGDDLALTVRVRALSVSGEQAGAPVVVWAEGRRDVPPDGAGCERLELQAAGPGVWRGRLASLRRDLCLRALCGDAWTAAVRVAVAPMPRLLAPGWRSQAPDYAGQPAVDLPGPPGTATVLPGSRLTFSAEVVPAVGSVVLTVGSATTACTRSRDRWQADITATSAATVLVQAGWAGRTVELARGAIALDQDRPPTVELEGAGGNRVLPPGASIELSFTARDDLGLRRCALTVREASGGRGEPVRSWPVAAAPGPKEAGHKHRLVLDPGRFQPGRAYVVEAVAEDWNPAGAPAVSRPLVVRVQNPDEIQVSDAAVRAAIDSLRRAIAREREAEGISDNLLAQGELPPARLGAHRDAIARPQNDARAAGRESRQRFEKAGDLHAARALEPVVEGEMGLVERDLGLLPKDPQPRQRLAAIKERQGFIVARLLAILGEAAERAQQKTAPGGSDPGGSPPSTTTAVRELAADLDEFLRKQQRLLERSRSLLEGGGLDLGDDKEKILGELAREEAALAKFIEEKLTDFSKLPPQDFADGTLLSQFNSVYQEIAQASKDLYQKRIELAVPHEQSGLELATQLQHNLEKWMNDRPDNIQWKMEEAMAPADVPISELPKQLEDIVGELLDKEEEMSEDIEDVTSAWMDNLDKGAGWLAADGPISNMSAKGITGNMLPNQNEIGGRSGEGRTGRSHGQMVENEAWGKGGRETPTRLTPSTFESGSVKDHSTDPTGGATGGGKVAGSDAEGLRGPVPPELKQALQRLSGNQAKVRQEAGDLALRLRKQGAPVPQLEAAVTAMQAMEEATRKADGAGIRSRYSEAVDALKDTRREMVLGGLGREKIRLERSQRDGMTQGAGAGRVPPGYEEMTSRYFQELAKGE